MTKFAVPVWQNRVHNGYVAIEADTPKEALKLAQTWLVETMCDKELEAKIVWETSDWDTMHIHHDDGCVEELLDESEDQPTSLIRALSELNPNAPYPELMSLVNEARELLKGKKS